MKKNLPLTLFVLLVSLSGFAQNDKYWSSYSGSTFDMPKDKAVKRVAYPKAFKLFTLNIEPLSQKLFSIVDKNSLQSTTISLPNANGDMEQFEVFEGSNFEPNLQAKFPSIRAFSGKGITDKAATLKLSLSPSGIQTMIFRDGRMSEFIEPYSANHKIYSVFESSRNKGDLPWSCSTDDRAALQNSKNQIGNTSRPENSDGTLRTYRLAQSCNGEYSNYFGASSAGTPADQLLVLAAFNATLTRCNGVYEKDLAMHLNLVANSTNVIYYDPATDPYTTLGAWNTQLQIALNTTLTGPSTPLADNNAAYDIGHMFGASGGGGNAGCIGCICVDGFAAGTGATKGRGITSPADNIPAGDNFDIDYVVHEIGHQIGGTHTFSQGLEGSGTNREVGSGITIMGYAGITPFDVAPHSIDIFHQTSIAQIQANLATKTCGINTSLTTSNSTPVVAPVANRTIPSSTPFLLTGSATDANANDVLTYCWEQNDNSTVSGAASVASPTKVGGPNWLSFPATTNSSRTCPRLSTILAGNFITGPLPGGDAGANIEALSSVGRTLNFRLTVRDNANYIPLNKVAQTSFTDMVVTVDASTGPFLVISPNTPLSWFAGSSQTITWDVASTTGAPINCANVKISISTDGGFTFPTVLAASTSNDGTEVLTMPSTVTTTARIKIEAIGNIFFDISNTNFSLTTPPNDFNFGPVTTTTSACPSAATLSVTIPTTQLGGFSNPINVTTTAGVPAGTTVTFAPNPVTPGSSTVATLNNANTLAAGTYAITVTGTATGATTKTTTITFTINAGAGPVLTTNSAATTVCAPATATFTVATAATGVTYQWQVAQAATPTTFVNIGTATNDSYTTGATSAAMNGNVYRCIVSTQCGTTTSAAAVLTVNTSAAIVNQPTNQTACTGGTATFSVTASGAGVSYQWQSAIVAAGPWTNVGTNAATYVTAPLTITTPTFYRVIVTTIICPGTVTSNTFTLGISTTTAINTQPSAQMVCAPNTATFSVDAVGTGVTYQWQVATAAAPTTFTNVGTNSNSFTTAATMVSMNGNIYRVIVTGSCNVVTSNTATLTVNTAAVLTSVTVTPANATVCNTETITFNSVATGTGLTYQWQVAQAATPTVFVNIPLATNASFTTVPTTPAMSGNVYRLVVTTTTCPAVITSSTTTITVNTVAVIGTQPSAQQACIPQTATFTVAATGTGLTYQWQMATAAAPIVFTNIPLATNASYTTGASSLPMNGNLYRVSILSTCSPTTPTVSNAALLTVTNPVAITAQPVALSGCIGDNYTFTSTATSPGNNITFQWQVSLTGAAGSYTNIPGATGTLLSTANATFPITNAPAFLNGRFYRVFYSVPCGTGISADTSTAARLNISFRPTVELTAPKTTSTNAAVNQGVFTTISPVTATGTFTWTKNSTLIPNTLAATFITLPIDGNGSYQVKLKDPNTGCEATSNVVVVTEADNIAKGQLFVYPNPARNMVEVRYNYPNLGTTGATLALYDEKGARVMVKTFTVNNTFGRMSVDMSNLRPATYIIYILDASGKILADTKVIKVP